MFNPEGLGVTPLSSNGVIKGTPVCLPVHWVPLTMSSVTMNTRLQQADFFASHSLTAMLKARLLQAPSYNEHYSGPTVCLQNGRPNEHMLLPLSFALFKHCLGNKKPNSLSIACCAEYKLI